MEQAVPTDAGEEIQERRASSDKAEAGEILKAWDIKRSLEQSSAGENVFNGLSEAIIARMSKIK
jgi:hypothetical protein